MHDLNGDYPAGSTSDPVGASSDTTPMSPAGSWTSFRAPGARVARRYGLGPTFRWSYLGVGFHLARSLP